jgi:hypothetical protein
MYCTKCGAEISEDDRFCPECGAKIESVLSAGSPHAKGAVGIATPVNAWEDSSRQGDAEGSGKTGVSTDDPAAVEDDRGVPSPRASKAVGEHQKRRLGGSRKAIISAAVLVAVVAIVFNVYQAQVKAQQAEQAQQAQQAQAEEDAKFSGFPVDMMVTSVLVSDSSETGFVTYSQAKGLKSFAVMYVFYTSSGDVAATYAYQYDCQEENVQAATGSVNKNMYSSVKAWVYDVETSDGTEWGDATADMETITKCGKAVNVNVDGSGESETALAKS